MSTVESISVLKGFITVGVLSPLKALQLIGVTNKLTITTFSEGPSKRGVTSQDGAKTDAVAFARQQLV